MITPAIENMTLTAARDMKTTAVKEKMRMTTTEEVTQTLKSVTAEKMGTVTGKMDISSDQLNSTLIAEERVVTITATIKNMKISAGTKENMKVTTTEEAILNHLSDTNRPEH